MLKSVRKSVLATLFLLIANNALYAQSETTISGRVIDSATKAPLSFATIVLVQPNDTLIKAAAITDESGRFVIVTSEKGNHLLRITLLNYFKRDIPVLIGSLSNILDLGKIELSTEVKALAEVTVTGRRDAVSSGLEKKTFDVARNISQSGGSIMDAMRNLPGVTIDPEGEIMLRGSDKILILIDGKQSGLTGFGNQKGLENIPASAIERIEIINNPSSKFDAAGMAGVINIIMKKEKKKGFNGSAGATFGIGELTMRKSNLPDISPKYAFTPKFNPSVSLNYRAEKVNLFLHADGMLRRKVNSNEFSTRTYTNGAPSVISQFLENRSQQSYNIKGGADFLLNDKNSLTVYGLFQDEYHIDRGDVPYDNLLTGKRIRLWGWAEDERTYFMNYAANYKHKFVQPGHELGVGFLYTKGNEDEVFPFTDSSAVRKSNDETHLITQESVASVSIDYTKPLKSGKLEAGTKLQLRQIPISYIITPGTNSVLDPNLGEWSKYEEDIYAAYLNYIREGNKIEIEGGLRLEQTNINYNIDPANNYYTRNEAYNYLSLFPNVRLTYKVDSRNKLSLFFNRRVDRPGEFELRPFPKYDDPEILKVGNPYLRPQFTNTIELAYKNNWKNGSAYVSLFNRFIENYLYRIYTNDLTPGSTDLYAIPQNLNNGKNLGIEISFDQIITPKWNLNANMNWYRNTISAAAGEVLYPVRQSFSFTETKMNTWNVKLNNNFSLPGKTDFQITAVYYAPDLIPQGTVKERFSFDIGLKKKVFKSKADLTFAATDLFNTFSIRKDVVTQNFSISAYNYYESQVISIGLNYKF